MQSVCLSVDGSPKSSHMVGLIGLQIGVAKNLQRKVLRLELLLKLFLVSLRASIVLFSDEINLHMC